MTFDSLLMSYLYKVYVLYIAKMGYLKINN